MEQRKKKKERDRGGVRTGDRWSGGRRRQRESEGFGGPDFIQADGRRRQVAWPVGLIVVAQKARAEAARRGRRPPKEKASGRGRDPMSSVV